MEDRSRMSSLQLYPTQVFFFIFFVEYAVSSSLISILEREVVTIGNTKFLASMDVPECAVHYDLTIEIPLPAYILVLFGMVEHGSQTKDDGLGLALRPVVGVVVEAGLFDVLDIFLRVEDQDGTDIYYGS